MSLSVEIIKLSQKSIELWFNSVYYNNFVWEFPWLFSHLIKSKIIVKIGLDTSMSKMEILYSSLKQIWCLIFLAGFHLRKTCLISSVKLAIENPLLFCIMEKRRCWLLERLKMLCSQRKKKLFIYSAKTFQKFRIFYHEMFQATWSKREMPGRLCVVLNFNERRHFSMSRAVIKNCNFQFCPQNEKLVRVSRRKVFT